MTIAPVDPATLLGHLHPAGELPALCGSAFLAVPRATFIPRRAWIQPVDPGPYEPVDRDTEPQRWFAGVNGNHVIATQFDDGATRWPDAGHRPTCSASMPSAVAGMLAELDPQPGEHVYEIGTGTGYNAALIAHVVGPAGRVTTVEVDAGLAEVARMNLAAAGARNVEVRHADAVNHAVPGPVDRVIATASVQTGELPYDWVANTRPGGVIVAPMRTHLSSGPVVRFVVGEDGTATGHATKRMRVGFMQLRSQRMAGGIPGLRWDDPAADVSYTDLAPWPVLSTSDHRWPVALALPRCVYDLWTKTEQRRGVAWLRDPLSGSWATVSPLDDDRFIVRQHGPRRLWDDAETAYRWWRSQGEPPLEAWLWTVGPTRQSIALPPTS
jgi:protein-L-isoaspartate O-methyltransferase